GQGVRSADDCLAQVERESPGNPDEGNKAKHEHVSSGSSEQARCLCHSPGFMESLHSLLRMHWDHEPDWHPSPCPLPARRGEGGRRPGEGRFMESLLSFFACIGTMNHPLTRPPGTLSPSEGERDGVRGACMGGSTLTTWTGVAGQNRGCVT